MAKGAAHSRGQDWPQATAAGGAARRGRDHAEHRAMLVQLGIAHRA
jgi:hypothetical protein